MHAPLCGIFGSHSVNVAHYASLIRVKSPTNCDAHLTESNFQTRSSLQRVRLCRVGGGFQAIADAMDRGKTNRGIGGF